MDLPPLSPHLPLHSLKLPKSPPRTSIKAPGTLPPEETAPSDRERLKREKIAKEFEAVFVSHMLGEMKKGIGQWGFEEDSTSQQIQDLFWTFLGQEAGRQGGIGLWKDIYHSMLQTEETSTPLLDTNL